MDQLNINVKTLDSKVFNLSVPSNVPVPELKVRIEALTQVPASSQRLIFQGKVLKDEQTLNNFPIKDGQTIHMVEKPAQAGGASAPTPSTDPSPSNQPRMHGPRVIGVPVVFSASAGPGQVQGGPIPNDMQHMLNSVLAGMGMPPGLHLNQQAQPQPQLPGDPFAHVRHMLTHLDTVLLNQTPSSSSSTSTTSSTTPAPSPNTPSATPSTTPMDVSPDQSAPPPPPTVATLGGLLAQTSALMRTVTQRLDDLSNALAQEPQMTDANRRLETQRLAEATGPAAGQLGVLLSSLAPTLTTLSMGLTPGSAQMPSLPGGQQRHIITPNGSIAIHFQTEPIPQGAAPAGATQIRLHVPTAQGQRPGVPGPFAPMLQPVPGGPAPAGSPAGVGINLMQMLGGQPGAAPGQQPMNPSDQAVLSNLANVLGNAFANPGAQGPQPAQSLLSLIGPTEESTGPLDGLLQTVLGRLTPQDVVAAQQGSLEPLDRLHPALQAHLRDLLQGDASEARLRAYAIEVADTFQAEVNEAVLPPDLLPHVRPGQDLIGVAAAVIRKHMYSLLTVVMQPVGSGPAPHPFAQQVRDWTRTFVRELIDNLAACMTGGVEDALRVVQRFVQQKFNGFGPVVSSLCSQGVTSYIMRTYQEATATAGNPGQAPQGRTGTHVQTTTPTPTPAPSALTPSTTTIPSITPASTPTPFTPTSTPAPAPAPVPVRAPVSTPVPAAVSKPAASPMVVAKPAPSAAAGVVSRPASHPPVSAAPRGPVSVSVPAEWAAVIAQDEVRQRDMPPQGALSEAYETGPAAKRKR
eukprot:TRINITY_DN2802_c0_g1_i6.p1 TRINITY_DN2802_c0_g1~~TRINITY_DN2802_c0_g1_i6.p1  ORF type:complete len:800 (+),score=168.46 TRINITY_DN2802_c0_g1_i6:1-2400(+)